MKKILFFIFIAFQLNAQNSPKVTSGSIIHIKNFESKFVDARKVDVWLPEGYSKRKRYPVLYMQDGQMLFDTAIAWKNQAWEVDEIAGKLIAEGKAQKFIVVAIWNNNNMRHAEYFPLKPFEFLTSEQRDDVSESLQAEGIITTAFNPISDLYLQFLVKELKPYIDKRFATKRSKKYTFIAGASMGALISIYAICEYPNTFGGAACLSTHWLGTFKTKENPVPDAFLAYLKTNLPNPKSHKIYFDYGNQTLDAAYPFWQKKVDLLMIEKGYTEKNWNTIFAAGENHSEIAWNKRLHLPILFLFKY
jgi:enterochelin esterase-like enzyme